MIGVWFLFRHELVTNSRVVVNEKKKETARSIPHDTSVNDTGELVVGMDTAGLGEDRREEFTGFAIKVAKAEQDELCSHRPDLGFSNAIPKVK